MDVCIRKQKLGNEMQPLKGPARISRGLGEILIVHHQAA